MQKPEAIVIGSGIGGMSAAAHLTAAGVRTLVIEKSPHLGGRCSHRVIKGFTVTTGAIMVPMGEQSAIRQAFDAVGAQMNMIETTGKMRYRLPHGDYDLPDTGGGLLGMIEFALEGGTKEAERLFQFFIRALSSWTPLDSITIGQWLDQYTENANVKNLFQGFCAALMGTGLHEIPAGEFFRFLKYSSKGSRFGLAANGNGELIEALASAITKRGSAIRKRVACDQILVEDGRATGVVVHNENGEKEKIEAPLILSNTGPVRTMELAGGTTNYEESYLAQLALNPTEAPIIHVSFATDKPLIEDFHGSLVFGNTRNLIYLEIPSLISPAQAPEGKYLHVAYGASRDASNPDLDTELNIVLAELDENFRGMLANATFIKKAKHSGQAPGMHRWAGHMMPNETPIRNLYNVGDGATPPGTIGTEGAAASGKAAVEKILADRARSGSKGRA